jgi:hypothetical protein
MKRASLGLVALLLLAGCSGGNHPKASPDEQAFQGLDLKATSTTGILRGVVVDDAIRPIAGAQVDLTGGPASAAPQSTKSTDQGAFAFDNLAPGTYFVHVQKGGYSAAQQSADVVAGVSDPAAIKVQLLRDASYVVPFAETYVFDGFIECSAGFADQLGDYAVENACSESVDPGMGVPPVTPFSNSVTFAQYNLSKAPTYVQSEAVWQSTQAASKSLNLNFAVKDDSALDGWDDLSVDGPSPLLNAMDNATAAHFDGKDNVLTLRVFPWTDSTPGPIVSIEQKFTVYTTVFYGYQPPADWRLSSGDPVPAPPV